MNIEGRNPRGLEAQAGVLSVEWGMPLMVRIQGLSESHRCKVVGMERGEYLICSAPAIPGLYAKLHDHNQVIVRYVRKGAVFGFRCTLLGLMNDPFRLIILSYPESTETVKLRKHDRIACFIPATVKANEMTYKGMVRDLSAEGCGIAFSVDSGRGLLEIRPPFEGTLSMQIPGLQDPVNVSIEVVNLRNYNGKVILGGRFKEPDPDVLSAIRTHIETIAETRVDFG